MAEAVKDIVDKMMKKKKDNIIYTDNQKLDLVAPLWQKLIIHHKLRSQYFREHFDMMTWEKRKRELLEKSKNGAMLVDLAKDAKTGAIVGYCVSTINANKHGEIESIFIEEIYRRQDIGDNFIKRALDWFDKHSITRRVIAVSKQQYLIQFDRATLVHRQTVDFYGLALGNLILFAVGLNNGVNF